MKVRGVVVIDLSRARLTGCGAAATARGIVWASIADAPAGADVRLVVPSWDSSWCIPAIDLLIEYGEDLGAIDVEGDAASVRHWVLALRHGTHVLGAGW